MFKLDDGKMVKVSVVASDDTEPLFTQLNSRSWWLVYAAGGLKRDIVSISRLSCMRKLKAAIAKQLGKHTRQQWIVNAEGAPLTKRSVLNITADNVSLVCMPLKAPIYLQISQESLAWLTSSISHDLREGIVDVSDDDDDDVKPIDSFTQDDLGDLMSHGIRWRPSKRELRWRDPLTRKWDVVKVSLNMRKQRKHSRHRFEKYVASRASKAKAIAIARASSDPSFQESDHIESDGDSENANGGSSASRDKSSSSESK